MKKKTIVGAVVMSAAILLAIPLGTGRTFQRYRKDVQDVFYYDKTGYSVYTGLETRTEKGRDLLTLAQRYSTDENVEAAAKELEQHVQYLERNFGWDESLAEQVQANLEMGTAAKVLADALENTALAEKDQKYPRLLLADLDAEQDKLERSSYNDAARAYNARLEQFPVSLLKRVISLRPLGVFEKEK